MNIALLTVSDTRGEGQGQLRPVYGRQRVEAGHTLIAPRILARRMFYFDAVR